MSTAIVHRRRQCIQTGMASVLGLPVIAQAQPAATGGFLEPAHELPVGTDADVIVCGAGPAAVTVVITAANAATKKAGPHDVPWSEVQAVIKKTTIQA